jgi:predicted RNase H-like nuclease (RuvC/YqgF family)
MSREEAEELMSYVESSKYEGIRGLELEIQETHDRLQKLKSNLEKMKKRRTLSLLDVVGDRTVIRFTKTFGSGKQYHYAGIKSDGYWYVTSNGYEYKKTLAELVKFIGDNPVEIMAPNKEL